MPVDPNIPLGITTPAPINALQTLAGVQSYQTNALQQKALGAQIQSNQAQSQAIQQNTDANGNVDWKGATSALAKDPNGGYNILPFSQAAQGLQTGQVGLQRQQVGLDSDQLENAKSHLNWAYQTASAVANNPNATTDDVFSAISQAVKAGQITPQTASQAISDMPPAGAPPGALQRWAANHAAQAAGAAAQLGLAQPAVSTVDTGPAINQVATDKLSGVPTVTGTFAKGLSPDSASTPTAVYDPATGTPGTVPRSQYVGMTNGSPPPLPTVPALPGTPASGGAVAPLPSGPGPGGMRVVPSGPALGAEARANTTATSDAQMGQGLIAQGDAQAPQLAALKNMRADLQNFTSGPTSGSWLALKQLGSAYNVNSPEMQQKVASQEGFNKLAANLVSAQSQTMGVPTDSKVLVAQSGNPNATLSNLGNKEMINYLIGNAQFTQAKSQAWTAAQSSPTPPTYAQFQSQWNKMADPAVFHYANMEPTQRANYLKSLSPAERAAFQQKGNTALQNGWITPGQ